jgi:hypothetical protein
MGEDSDDDSEEANDALTDLQMALNARFERSTVTDRRRTTMAGLGLLASAMQHSAGDTNRETMMARRSTKVDQEMAEMFAGYGLT